MEYTAFEQTEIRFAVAARNNPQLNGVGVKSLQAYIAQQARSTVLSREQITATVTQLTQQGRSEQQIKAITTAAIGLAQATGTDLASASEQVAATYSGQARELGRLYPAIRQMTENDLRAGKAAEYLAQANRGVAEAMAGSVGGRLQQLKNTMQETMESIGGAVAPILIKAIEAIKPIIEKIGTWFQNNTQRIVNFFQNIPELAKLAMNALIDIVIEYITHIPEIVKNIAIALFHFQIDLWKLQWQMIVDVAKVVFAVLWDPLKKGFEIAVYWIKKTWHDFVSILASLGNETVIPVFNSILDAITKVINGILDVVDHVRAGAVAAANAIANPLHAAEELSKTGAIFAKMQAERQPVKIEQLQKFAVAPFTEKAPPPLDVTAWGDKIKDAIKNTLSDAWKGIQTEFQDAIQLAIAAGKPVADVLQQYAPKFLAILNKGVGVAQDSFNLFYKDVHGQIPPSGNSLSNLLLALAANVKSELFAVEAMRTDLSNPNKTTGHQMTSGIGLAAGADPLIMILEELAKFASQIAAVNLLLNPLETILTVTFRIITPLVNTILAPLVGFLAIMGNTIGRILIPIFQQLEPLLTLISMGLVFMYNYAILPLSNMIIAVLNILYDAMAYIWNAIAGAINAVLGWAGVHVNTMEIKAVNAGFLTPITMGQMTAAGQAAEAGAGGTGAQAQYTGQQAIIVTIQNYFGTASVVGIDNFVAEIMRDIQAANATNQGVA